MTTYHWILTLSGHFGPDCVQTTVGGRGTVIPEPTATRESITNGLIAEVRASFAARQDELLQDVNVLFFSLEPNQLP